jgi:hypothetical protein
MSELNEKLFTRPMNIHKTNSLTTDLKNKKLPITCRDNIGETSSKMRLDEAANAILVAAWNESETGKSLVSLDADKLAFLYQDDLSPKPNKFRMN